MFGGGGGGQWSVPFGNQKRGREERREWGGMYQKRSELAAQREAPCRQRRSGVGTAWEMRSMASWTGLLSQVRRHLPIPDTVFSGNVNTQGSNSATIQDTNEL